MHAQTRLETAIQKIAPYLRKVSVPMRGLGSLNGETCSVRYFFRDAGLGQAQPSLMGGFLAHDLDASTHQRVSTLTRPRVDTSTRRRVDASMHRRVDASTRRRVDAVSYTHLTLPTTPYV